MCLNVSQKVPKLPGAAWQLVDEGMILFGLRASPDSSLRLTPPLSLLGFCLVVDHVELVESRLAVRYNRRQSG